MSRPDWHITLKCRSLTPRCGSPHRQAESTGRLRSPLRHRPRARLQLRPAYRPVDTLERAPPLSQGAPVFDSLRGARLELDLFAERLLQLTDEAINTILSEVPADFGREHLPAIAERLREARDDSAGFLSGITEVAR